MLNQVVLVGRLVKNVKVYNADCGQNVTTVTLAIPRSFKNMEGVYETDFIDCVAFENIADNTAQYCRKGDIIGVKGRLQSRVEEKDKKKEYYMDVIAEKITFLTSKKEADAEEKEARDDQSSLAFLCVFFFFFLRSILSFSFS